MLNYQRVSLILRELPTWIKLEFHESSMQRDLKSLKSWYQLWPHRAFQRFPRFWNPALPTKFPRLRHSRNTWTVPCHPFWSPHVARKIDLVQESGKFICSKLMCFKMIQKFPFSWENDDQTVVDFWGVPHQTKPCPTTLNFLGPWRDAKWAATRAMNCQWAAKNLVAEVPSWTAWFEGTKRRDNPERKPIHGSLVMSPLNITQPWSVLMVY